MHLVAAAMGAEGDLAATRLDRGCRCFAVWLDGELGGYGWLSTRPEWIGELQLEITPRPGEAYIWNCVTMVEHRRRGIFRSLLVGISGVARREGLKRLWVGSVAIPAEKAVAPSGFRPALHFTTLAVIGLHAIRVDVASDRGLVEEARSVLGIDTGFHLRRSHARRH